MIQDMSRAELCAYQGLGSAMTGCVGADNYLDAARNAGYTHIEVLDWTSSAGDWSFIVSKDGRIWQVMWQTNNYPRPGFSYEFGEEVFEGTKEEALAYFSEGW